MGWNSVVIVMHDALHTIAEDPEFGAALARACGNISVAREGDRRRDVSARSPRGGGYGNAASVIYSGHADSVALILAGGNHGRVLGEIHNSGRHLQPDDERLCLKHVLEDLGYQLRGRRKDAQDISIVDKIGKLQEGDDMRARLTALERQNEVLRLALAEAEAKLAAVAK